MAHLRHFVALHYLGRDWHKASFRCIARPVTLLEQQRTSGCARAELVRSF